MTGAPDIAVVGGGTTAACLLDAFARHLPPGPGTLTVYEPEARLWHGRVYQDDSPEIITNIPAKEMSIRHGDPGHAVRWLTAHGHGEEGDGTQDWCPPRALMGRYMADTADEAADRLRRAGWQVRILPERVVRVRPAPGGLVVDTRLHATLHGHLVLCVGHPELPDHYRLDGHPRYVSCPYPTRTALAPIPPGARVAVIGTGVTAVDIVAALHARRHTGRIVLASRRGLLRAARTPPGPALRPLKHLTPERIADLHHRHRYSLDALVTLIREELRTAGHAPQTTARKLTSRAAPLTRLREGLHRPDHDLDLLRQAIPVIGQQAWVLLPPDDRRRLLARHHHTFMALGFPMPAVNARLLDALAATGQLQVLPGIHAVGVTGDYFTVATRTTATTAHWVVNAATPAVRDTPRDARDLIDSLVGHGLAVRDPFGGLTVQPGTNRLVGPGRHPDRRLYALGDLTHGSLYVTFGIPVVTPLADRIARTIAHDHEETPAGHHRAS
ncbi:FAD/NAD(P)-binding protein [Streptomyces sp. V2]|uniref:FAD/NAD(P)-binding protein n=1 Tax=Streptomyces sp. V2 TaxID=1424099 RepID=UPI001403F948|nr:FAD/NAD(P)-binding protein [Streptomyces sp. V2]